MPVSVVIATGKDGVSGDGERGAYSSEGEQEWASFVGGKTLISSGFSIGSVLEKSCS